MPKKKKNKNEIDKRRAKAKQKKSRQQKSKTAKSSDMPDFMLAERPMFSDISAPEGFCPVSMNQALMKYAEPLLELVREQDTEALNGAMQVATTFWNYQIALEHGRPDKRLEADLLDLVKNGLRYNSADAKAFMRYMLERKNHLFPPEIQPKGSAVMFMRKEVSHLITRFNYDNLDLNGTPLAPGFRDRAMVMLIEQMDQYLIDGAEYDNWEKHYLLMEEQCAKRFKKWLIKKGMREYSDDFPFYLNVYLNFIYRYGHDDLVTLKTVSAPYLEEFLFDHILRKVMVEPHEYTRWPPAMKLFYRFLYEKNYLDDPGPVIDQLNKIEPRFIEILRKRFA